MNLFSRIRKNRFLLYGAPFLTFLVAGSFGLQQLNQFRYIFRRTQRVSKEDAIEMGVSAAVGFEDTSMEKEYQKLKNENIDNWEQVRGPRPWEDSKTIQDEQRAERSRSSS